MSRTTRKRWVPDENWETWHCETVREKTCKPGCGVCGKDKRYNKQERKQKRRADRVAIDEQLM